MKTPLLLPAILCILAISAVRVNALPDGDAAVSAQPLDAPAMTYDTAERIAAMPRCRGTVLELFSCCALMSTADGVKFWIGSPAATNEVVRFVETLKEDEDYAFPDAFVAWQRERQRAKSIVAVVF